MLQTRNKEYSMLGQIRSGYIIVSVFVNHLDAECVITRTFFFKIVTNC